jgi:chromosome segregation ATPase
MSGSGDTEAYGPDKEGTDTKVYEKEKKEMENAEHVSEEELQQLKKAEKQLENMINEEEKALEIKKDAASDLSDAFSYFKKIESDLQHLDRVHEVMHSRGLSREDLSEEEMETWTQVIEDGKGIQNIQKELEGVIQLLRDAESDIQKLEQIEADEEDKTKKEDQSLQKQIDAVEDVLTAIQDIRKLDREQA